MKTSSLSVVFGSILVLTAVLGAGCGRASKSVERPDPFADQRVMRPDLGFSYVPYTTSTPVSDGSAVSGTRIFFGDTTAVSNALRLDFIDTLPRPANQSVEETLASFLKSTGGSPETCSIIIGTAKQGTWNWLSEGLTTATFVPKKAYEPTDQEIELLLGRDLSSTTTTDLRTRCQNSPECDFIKQDLLFAYNKKQCGFYAANPRYQAVSMFITDPQKEAPLLYIHTIGGGSRPVFDGGDIRFLGSSK